MRILWHSLLLFLLFFTFQTVFAEGGIISLIREHAYSNRLEKNISTLIDINKKLSSQANLARSNKSYIWMNAHRVGLLADDEYLVRVPKSLFSTTISYSPGTIVKRYKNFGVSAKILFFIALSVQCIMFSCRVFFKKST